MRWGLADKTSCGQERYPVKGQARAEHAVHCRALKLAKALNVRVEELFSEEATVSTATASFVATSADRCPAATTTPAPPLSPSRSRSAARCCRSSSIRFARFESLDVQEHLGEFIFVHEGQVEVDFANQRIILERGDALHFNAPEAAPHPLLGETQAELLVW